jgi:uncharacterized protein YggU (UPF0235/DUF167 family)
VSPFVAGKDGAIRFAVTVRPRGGRDAILGLAPDGEGGVAIRLAVKAAPEDGKANAAVIALLAKALGVRRADLSVQSGATARRKLMRLAGGDIAALDRWALALDRAADS